MNSSHYKLHVGLDDSDRLDILNEIYTTDSLILLDRAFRMDDVHSAIDLGCGHGHMSRHMAARLRPKSGIVIGLDSSEDQLMVARQCTPRALKEVVTYESFDVCTSTSNLPKVDLAYCRFLLMHVRDARIAVHNISELTVPSGLLVIEEPSLEAQCCNRTEYPVDEITRMITKFGDKIGANYNFGVDLVETIDEFADIQSVSFHQPTLVTERHKSIMPRSFLQLIPRLIEYGITTPQAAHSLHRKLEDMAMDPTAVLGGLRVTQVIARARVR